MASKLVSLRLLVPAQGHRFTDTPIAERESYNSAQLFSYVGAKMATVIHCPVRSTRR